MAPRPTLSGALLTRLFIDGEAQPELQRSFTPGAQQPIGWQIPIACEDSAPGLKPAERVVQVGGRIPGLWGGKTEGQAQDLGCGGCQSVPTDFSTTLLAMVAAQWFFRRRGGTCGR